MSEQNLIIKAEDLKVYYPVKKGIFSRSKSFVKAVDGLSLEVRKGETLGVVGETGSGKSTLGRAILGLEPLAGGSLIINGKDTKGMSPSDMLTLRHKMQMVFQDPYSSFNPRQRIGESIVEPMLVHKILSKEESEHRAIDLLETVGLSIQHYYRRPHEFSGGQRQRIGVARALALNPEFIVCDEPVSALDVSIQASILNLLIELQDKYDLTYMFISHDLRVVRYIADRVIVMYLGVILEQGETDSVYQNPRHPYTKALISAMPEAKHGSKTNRIVIEGDVPSPIDLPSGCRMHTRCDYVCDICKEQTPELREIEYGHTVACHMAEKI